MSELWSLQQGNGPVIVNVPHAGTHFPAAIHACLTKTAKQNPDADWHVDKLYRPSASAFDATLMVATHSRIVVDLNRDPSGDLLYPGASNTEICPLTTFDNEPIYRTGNAPGARDVEARVRRYWQPYHTQLGTEIERIKSRHGYCVLLDAHSIVSVVPRFFPGRLPDFNLGTADGTSCDSTLASAAYRVLSDARNFSAVHNGRFKGGYITRNYGRPAMNVHALQLEMAQCCYMDENEPNEHSVVRAAPVLVVLQSLLESLTLWQQT